MEKPSKRVLTLDSYQHGVVIHALNELRNDLIHEQRPTDIVDEVLVKTIDAPSKSRKGKCRDERQAKMAVVCAGPDSCGVAGAAGSPGRIRRTF